MAAPQDVDEVLSYAKCSELGVECVSYDKVVRFAQVHEGGVRGEAPAARLYV